MEGKAKVKGSEEGVGKSKRGRLRESKVEASEEVKESAVFVTTDIENILP